MDRQSLAGFFDELDKIGQFGGDIDDLYAAPNSTIVPTLKRVHNIGKMKGSSWADIGPVGQREGRDAQYPKLPWERDKIAAEKTAEPPPPPGVTAEQWDKILSRKSKSEEIAKTARLFGLVKDPTPEEREAAARRRHQFRLHRKPVSTSITMLRRKLQGRDVETGRRLEKQGYRLQGHDNVQGLRIAIENRKGSVRKGTDSDGNEWRTKMVHPYGYLVGTKGADGEPVDCYVGPDKEAPAAFVVHQHKVDGTGFDEDKVMLGFKTKKEAKEAYLKHYDDPKFLGPISKLSVERLRNLVKSKKKLVKIAKAEEKEQGKVTRFLRKAGPGLGGLAGAGIGALIGARRGKLLQGALTGLGTGATLGWVPDMAHGVREGVQELR